MNRRQTSALRPRLGVAQLEYEMMIGLETHVELSTNTKIFCGCPIAFGGEPNSRCCPVCTGQPGALPMLNQAVVEYAVKAGLALHCHIHSRSQMARKHYVYPDLPKGYQISQQEKPLCYDGFMNLSDGTKIRINRIHIEEDAGKLIHKDNAIFIDYNRGGVPLIEIVTEPDFRSAKQVREYLEELRLMMKYLHVSDCKMQEGSLRCDVNLSVRPRGSEAFGTRTEIKNVNSLSFIEKAIDSEYKRQIGLLKQGETIVQQTLRYNEATNCVEPMRFKEDSDDYRYFPEPDIPEIFVSQQEVEAMKRTLPELPSEKRNRYCREWGLSRQDSEQLTKYQKIAEYFEEMVHKTAEPKLCANVMLTHLFRFLNKEEEKEGAEFPLDSHEFAVVVHLIAEGTVPNQFLKQIVDTMMTQKKSFYDLFDPSEFVVDDRETEQAVLSVLAQNEKAVADFKQGKEKAMGALIGQVMRFTKGKADAKKVEEMIRHKLK